ncbi:unnamed protein product [Caretta caretta]
MQFLWFTVWAPLREAAESLHPGLLDHPCSLDSTTNSGIALFQRNLRNLLPFGSRASRLLESTYIINRFSFMSTILKIM